MFISSKMFLCGYCKQFPGINGIVLMISVNILWMLQMKVDTALSEDEGETDTSYLGEGTEGLSIKADSVTPTPGGPFSALTPSMWPQDILTKLGQQPDDPNSQPEYR